MTVMTATEARREKRRNAISHALPDADAIIEAVVDDLMLAAEFDAADDQEEFDCLDDVAEYVEETAVAQIRRTARDNGFQPADTDWSFVQSEIEHARWDAYHTAMERFEAADHVTETAQGVVVAEE